MAAAGAAIGVDQGRLAASPCTTTSLSIVGGCGRHITKIHNVEVTDVHTQFHGWTAVENLQFPFSEITLTLLSLPRRDLGCMFPSLKTQKVLSRFPVERQKEWIGGARGYGLRWLQKRVVGYEAIPHLPYQGISRNLIAGDFTIFSNF